MKRAKKQKISGGRREEIIFRFRAEVWVWEGPATWYFVSLPKNLSIEIDALFDDQKRGWGSLPVRVTIKDVAWTTSIFPAQEGYFILPLKAAVRKQAGLSAGDLVEVALQIRI